MVALRLAGTDVHDHDHHDHRAVQRTTTASARRTWTMSPVPRHLRAITAVFVFALVTMFWWIVEHKVRVLNVAGNRESRAPGIGARVERFLADVFRRLGHGPI
jgi:hypothetical protein